MLFRSLTSGFGFGLFVGIALLGSGAYPLDSPWLVWLPVIGLAVGLAGAIWSPRPPRAVTPLARATAARASSAPVAPPASPDVWSEPGPEAPTSAPPIADDAR